MNTDELLKALIENGCRVCIGLSEYGDGFDLQVNTDEGIIYLDPLCESVRPGLLDVWPATFRTCIGGLGQSLYGPPRGRWSKIQVGERLIPMKGSGPPDDASNTPRVGQGHSPQGDAATPVDYRGQVVKARWG